MFEGFFLCSPHPSQVNTPINILTVSQRNRRKQSFIFKLCMVDRAGQEDREGLAAPAITTSGVPQLQRTPWLKSMPSGQVAASHWLRLVDKGGPQICSRAPRGLGQPAEYLNFSTQSCFPSPSPPQVSVKYSAPKTPAQWEPNLRQYCSLASFYIKRDFLSLLLFKYCEILGTYRKSMDNNTINFGEPDPAIANLNVLLHLL